MRKIKETNVGGLGIVRLLLVLFFFKMYHVCCNNPSCIEKSMNRSRKFAFLIHLLLSETVDKNESIFHCITNGILNRKKENLTEVKIYSLRIVLLIMVKLFRKWPEV